MGFIRPYVRRAPDAVMQRAVVKLHKLHADRNLQDTSGIVATRLPSQLLPKGRTFRKGSYPIINVGPEDMKSVTAAVATMYHESLHGRAVHRGGKGCTDKAHELGAHRMTIVFLRRWRRREKNPLMRKAIKGQIAEERASMKWLRTHDEGVA